MRAPRAHVTPEDSKASSADIGLANSWSRVSQETTLTKVRIQVSIEVFGQDFLRIGANPYEVRCKDVLAIEPENTHLSHQLSAVGTIE
jgi:hypothetical protein